MKKIVYIWVNNYKNIIIQQGYQLSPEILVEIKSMPSGESGIMKLSISMTDNRSNVLKNFYGKNISSVMAFVGKNGAGKTTVSRMLLEYLPNSISLNDGLINSELLKSLGVQSDWDNRFLYILYDDEKDTVFICPNNVDIQEGWNTGELKTEIINKDKIFDELSSAVEAGIYLTNVFNPSELLESYQKMDLGDGVAKYQQSYSPAFFLKHESEEQTKSLYGYRNGNKYISVIQRYAQSQMNSLFFAFMNKQAALFLESFYNVPDKLKEELPIYQEFGLEVIEFATPAEIMPYVNEDGDYNELYNKLDTIEQVLIHIKRIYIAKKNELSNDVLLKLYFNMLLEVYGVVFGLDIDINHAFERLFSDKITDIDSEILKNIKDYLTNSEYCNANWTKQILEFIALLQNQNEFNELRQWMGETGNRSFGEKRFLEWYYEQITKKTSFAKRNLIFRWKPTSSGEMAIANLFAYLDDAIHNLNIKEHRKNVLLIFDELDCYLHPKWQQYIVKMLFDRLQDYSNCTFQVIVSSHSPIILSDICKDNILKLDKLQGQLETMRTFGADISQLYYDSFFMEEGDIGDFAKQNIEYAIKKLDKESLNERILFIIENIGQDIVRNKLFGKYQALQRRKRLNENVNDNKTLVKRINALSAENRQSVMDYINQLEN